VSDMDNISRVMDVTRLADELDRVVKAYDIPEVYNETFMRMMSAMSKRMYADGITDPELRFKYFSMVVGGYLLGLAKGSERVTEVVGETRKLTSQYHQLVHEAVAKVVEVSKLKEEAERKAEQKGEPL